MVDYDNGDWRVIATRALTGEILSWDLPLARATTTRELSGPGGVFGVIDSELLTETASDGRPLLEQWSTALFVEESGQIRGGGIVSRIPTKGTLREIEAAGYSAYPAGIPYVANWLPGSPPDPTAVFAHLWEHVQSFPDADLGVVVDAQDTWKVLTGGGQAFALRDFEYRDCGDTMNQLATVTPFDYLEQHSWNLARTGINHRIKIGFPRLGRKRDDLVFEDSVNVDDYAYISPDGERYANDVYVYGQGAGSAMQKARASARDGRLRRCAVIQAPTTAGQSYLNQVARQELAARGMQVEITELVVKDHPNARLSAIQPGDDIMFRAEVPWFGDVRVWLRVLGITEVGEQTGKVSLRVTRSDGYVYASAESPTGDKVPVSI